MHNTYLAVKLTELLTAFELSKACKSTVKLIQQSLFANKITTLLNNETMPKSCKILFLNLFLESELILRGEGRLRKNSNLSYESKHQMLLFKHHPVMTAIIGRYHLHSLHGRTDLVLSLIRLKF